MLGPTRNPPGIVALNPLCDIPHTVILLQIKNYSGRLSMLTREIYPGCRRPFENQLLRNCRIYSFDTVQSYDGGF